MELEAFSVRSEGAVRFGAINAPPMNLADRSWLQSLYSFNKRSR